MASASSARDIGFQLHVASHGRASWGFREKVASGSSATELGGAVTLSAAFDRQLDANAALLRCRFDSDRLSYEAFTPGSGVTVFLSAHAPRTSDRMSGETCGHCSRLP
jgi:hypothetical protein